ncbi:hypothetical protein H4C81_23930 [Pseudomonas monteilii]|uniref:hypothetical protein n=1 Tax=Pseudomonas monteilii TaxID=76759 RepID=UPI0015FC4CD5|nr:hypothetical protein [Pseudomonas monteilii]MBA6091897.1 hypothetical protein [Pseudomonas monteilii]
MTSLRDNPSDLPPKSAGVTLESLIPPKKSVETSVGPIFIRKASQSDLTALENRSSADSGLQMIQLLSSQNEDKRDRDGLPQGVLDNLQELDLKALASAICNHNDWGDAAEGASVDELGRRAMDALKIQVAKRKEVLDKMRKTISASYDFLGRSSLEDLQKQMAELSSIRHDAYGSDSLESIARLTSIGQEAKPTVDFGKYQHTIPDVTDTPMGRATLESARNAKATAEKMDTLTGVVAQLSQTIIEKVLPAWFTNVKQGQLDAKASTENAVRGLVLTRRAIIMGACVAFAVGWWQVNVSKSLDEGSTVQQLRSEALLQAQLQSQQQLILAQAKTEALLTQQAADLQLIREQQARQEKLLVKQLDALERSLRQSARREAALLKALEQNRVPPSARP